MAADSAAEVDPEAVAADSASGRSERVTLLGVTIDAMRRSQIECRIAAHLADSNPTLLHIATVNPEYVVAAQRDPMFCKALAKANLRIPDGVGVVAAARVLCSSELERITGVDLVEMFLLMSFAPRVFLLGNPASIAQLQGRYPARVVGRWGDGSSHPSDDRASIERIAERGANVVLVGYGAPGQVLWIERNRAALESAGVKIAIGVGGALDFASGTVERAPTIVRKLGLEWAFRLVREPWRWRRQLALPVFAARVLRAWLGQRLVGNNRACRILAHDDESHACTTS